VRRLACVAIVHVAIIAVAASATPRTVQADDVNLESTERQRIVTLLSDYESLPDPQHVLAGGERTAGFLFDLYRDASLPTFVRVRALRSLSLFPADIAAARLTSVAREPGVRVVFVREAAIGLARCAGEAAIETLALLLARAEPHTRRGAVEALRTLATPKARAHLVSHRSHEADPAVRSAIDVALAGHQAR